MPQPERKPSKIALLNICFNPPSLFFSFRMFFKDAVLPLTLTRAITTLPGLPR